MICFRLQLSAAGITQCAWNKSAGRASSDGAFQTTIASGAKIGRHYGGPTWEANDGSKVIAGVAGRADVAGTIPWLRLTTRSVGGVAPASPCAQANAGTQARIPYTADYYLLGKS